MFSFWNWLIYYKCILMGNWLKLIKCKTLSKGIIDYIMQHIWNDMGQKMYPKYYIVGYFCPVLFSPFYTCKLFHPALNLLRHDCIMYKYITIKKRNSVNHSKIGPLTMWAKYDGGNHRINALRILWISNCMIEEILYYMY